MGELVTYQPMTGEARRDVGTGRERWGRQESEKKSRRGDGEQKPSIWWGKLGKHHHRKLSRNRLQGLAMLGKDGPSSEAVGIQKRAK